jgi:uncharacterized protein (TIGR00299 family) protein
VAPLAYLDLVGGAAGDMLLGALIHAGADLAALQQLIASLGLGARLEVRADTRQGIACRRVEVIAPPVPQPERHLSEVLEILEGGDLPASAAAGALATFRLLAEAEAEVHDSTPERVHFHEVGAIDALVDVAGVWCALHLLGVEHVEATPLPVAGGTVEAAHGTLPLPAPAVLVIARRAGIPVVGRPGRGEWVTPTAAAILGVAARRFGPYPALELSAVGYGAGTRTNPSGHPPNLTRVVLGRPPQASSGEVVVLETHLDDQSPEHTAYLCERLREAGALDVYAVATHTKKGRSGWLLTVLAAPARSGPLEDLLLEESSSLGLRRRVDARRVLEREVAKVETPFGILRVKRARRPSGRSTYAPEFEDCARAAREHGVPLDVVFEAALGACRALPG